jgi:hypothetical protein
MKNKEYRFTIGTVVVESSFHSNTCFIVPQVPSEIVEETERIFSTSPFLSSFNAGLYVVSLPD